MSIVHCPNTCYKLTKEVNCSIKDVKRCKFTKGGFCVVGKKITISLSEKMLEVLEEMASEKGVKKSMIITLALIEYMEKQKGEVHIKK